MWLPKSIFHLLWVVTYTGYTLEQLLTDGREDWMALLNETDILIDGRFEADKKSYECRFRGSTNQRYLDAKASVAAGKANLSVALRYEIAMSRLLHGALPRELPPDLG